MNLLDIQNLKAEMQEYVNWVEGMNDSLTDLPPEVQRLSTIKPSYEQFLGWYRNKLDKQS